MSMKLSFIIFVYLFVKIISSTNVSNTIEEFPHSIQLHSEFLVYWKVDNQSITFEVRAKTLGWVGLGISPIGGMINADIFVGWVDGGKGYITDRHGLNVNGFPPIDKKQNLEILMGSEVDEWTTIQFKRKLNTCDNEEDIEITADTLRIIWATGLTDPENNTLTGRDYHSSNKGTKKIFLLDSPPKLVQISNETLQQMDFLFEPTLLPAKKTYYACSMFHIPSLPSKHHIVQMEPIFGNSESEKYIHHILGYQCADNLKNPSIVGKSVECYTNDPENVDILKCKLLISLWSVGGGPFIFPSNVGMSLGLPGDPEYFRLEIHYNNPYELPGIIDSSGWRFIYTQNLREFDAGAMMIGHFVSPLHMIIPPNTRSFPVYGDCHPSCLLAAMQELNISSFNLFAVGHHTHNIGSSIEVKHIRRGKELKWISIDEHYDFNYQEVRYVNPSREILAGDGLQVVCNYTTKGKRANITTGGLSTEEEMCLAVLFYYPRFKISQCQSTAKIPDILNYLGVKKHSSIGRFSVRSSWKNVKVWKPKDHRGEDVLHYLNEVNWNDTTSLKFSKHLQDTTRVQFCYGIDRYQPSGYHKMNGAIRIYQPYKEEIPRCKCEKFGTNNSLPSLSQKSYTNTKMQDDINSKGMSVFPCAISVSFCFMWQFLFWLLIINS